MRGTAQKSSKPGSIGQIISETVSHRSLRVRNINLIPMTSQFFYTTFSGMFPPLPQPLSPEHWLA